MIWAPTRSHIESTNIWRFMQRLGFVDREDFLHFSTAEPERFWDEILAEMRVEWGQPFHQVLDLSRGPEWAQWFTGGRLNIAHNCLDRWAQSDRVACIWESENGESGEIRFAGLHRDANRVANGLVSLGCEPGDRVGLCLPMVPELLPILYGCFKAGLVAVPVFTGYGAAAIRQRFSDAGVRVVFTAAHVTRRGKLLPVKEKIPEDVEHIITLGENWDGFLSAQPDEFRTLPLDSEHHAMILYTSGTTGKPKGAVHTHAGVLAQTGKEIWLAFDHRDDDRFFWLTDIGWMMGPWTILGNHLFGGTIFLYDGAPDYPTPHRLWEMIARHRITTFGVSPTAIRLLRKHPVDPPPMPSLRLLGSTGEPWDDDSWLWFFEKAGRRCCPLINISGGTEIIGCFLSCLPIQPLKPCSLGGPAPGIAADVVDENGSSVRGRMGYLVCKQPVPSMTRGIWGDPERYLETYWSQFPGWWFHGDWASVDPDGHWFIHGRSDESMKVAGRKIGPAEVEEALLQHPSVAEAAAIGVPDELKGEAIVGYVVAKPGCIIDEAEVGATVAHVMGSAFRPREIVPVLELPKTQSGKIVRRLLRRKYLGEPLGDLSTVANLTALE